MALQLTEQAALAPGRSQRGLTATKGGGDVVAALRFGTDGLLVGRTSLALGEVTVDLAARTGYAGVSAGGGRRRRTGRGRDAAVVLAHPARHAHELVSQWLSERSGASRS